MKRLNTFPLGGIHPRNIGLNTLEKPICNASFPHFTYIPLSQHIGAPAKAVVAPGDEVSAGDVIGEASGFVSVNIHASLPGKVVDIVKSVTATAENVETVVVEFGGSLNLTGEKHEPVDWRKMSAKEIITQMQAMGIAGMGGACFPAHVKFSVPEDKKIDTFIINAVECEPFLSADYRLLMECTDDLLQGVEIAKKVLGVSKAYIGIESDTPKAIEKLQQVTADDDGIEIIPLQVKYPQGAEKQLIKAVTGREVPSGGLPMDVGAVVSNAGTIVAIKEAIVDEKPLLERVVTVTGTILERPGNYKIRIGTRIKDVLEEFGLKEEPGKIVLGGPMMGLAQYSDDVSVTKGTSGILVLSKKEAKIFNHAPCVRCGKCISVCPMGLDPARLVTLTELGKDEEALDQGKMDCIECGCCSYECPSQRHLAQSIKLGKLREISKRKEASRG